MPNVFTPEVVDRAQRRVKKLGDRELADWAEAAIPGMQRHLDLYRKTEEPAHLGEILLANYQLQLVVDELNERHEARRQEGLTP
jgi:hypothetical protein